MEIGLHDPGGEGHGTIHAHVHSIVRRRSRGAPKENKEESHPSSVKTLKLVQWKASPHTACPLNGTQIGPRTQCVALIVIETLAAITNPGVMR